MENRSLGRGRAEILMPPGWNTAVVIQPDAPGSRPPTLYRSVRDRNAL